MEKTEEKTYFAMIGLIISLMAFSLSVTSPWLTELIAPPPQETLEDIAVETALDIKDKLIKGLKGEEYKSPPIETKTSLADILPLIIILIALAGTALGTIGFVKKESARTSITAIALGITAIMAIYFLMIAAILLFILLIGAILSAIDLPV